MPDYRRSFYAVNAAPALEPKYLLVEGEGKRAGPRLELFRDESLKDCGEGALLADALIALGLEEIRSNDEVQSALLRLARSRREAAE